MGVRYRIDSAGVHTTLATARSDGAALVEHRGRLSAGIDSACVGCGGAGIVAAAVSALGAGERARIERMSARVDSCVRGASEAVGAYDRADRRMAADTAAADAGSRWPGLRRGPSA